MEEVETEGKTPEEAIEKALAKLGIRREEAKIEILSWGNPGFLSLIGSKAARVRVSVNGEDEEMRKAERTLACLLEKMGVDAEIKADREGNQILLQVKSPQGALLIGRRGKALDALEYMVNRILNSPSIRSNRVLIDVEDYRRRRREELEALAERLAEKVKASQEAIVISPLSPRERRIVHLALQGDKRVRTASEGAGPFRKVVISPVGPTSEAR